MKWIFRPICWVVGHDCPINTINYNPSTKLFRMKCKRCGGYIYEKDTD